MPDFEITKQNRVARLPDRGAYDKATVYPIIDEALICHVGLVQDGQPVVIPTLHARQDDTLLLHGATTSRLLKYAQSGQPICATMTLIDGLVLARSVFHHSMNYRSVVLFGQGHLIEEADEKLRAMQTFTERLLPGRWDDARRPNEKEIKATSVVAIPIELASAKVRTGPPGDDEEDLALPVWSGVLPLKQQFLSPQNAPNLAGNIPVPQYVADYLNSRNG